jgi:hypothetical protein
MMTEILEDRADAITDTQRSELIHRVRAEARRTEGVLTDLVSANRVGTGLEAPRRKRKQATLAQGNALLLPLPRLLFSTHALPRGPQKGCALWGRKERDGLHQPRGQEKMKHGRTFALVRVIDHHPHSRTRDSRVEVFQLFAQDLVFPVRELQRP